MRSLYSSFSYWKIISITAIFALCFHASSIAGIKGSPPRDTPPADVTDFTALPQGSQIALGWTNPNDGDFAGTMIRYRTDGLYPVNHHDGTLLCNRANRPASADAYNLNNVSRGTTYYFSAFTYDAAGNFSHTAHVSATPTANPPPNPPVPGSDTGGGGGGGCFIATAAFGSPMESHVRILSDFRDRYLIPNALGKKIVRFYYRTSPPVAAYLKDHDTTRRMVRYTLVPVTALAYLSINTHPAFVFSAIILLTAVFGYAAIVIRPFILKSRATKKAARKKP